MKDADLADKYRKHALAIRAASKFEGDAQRSFILKRIALDYDQMAQTLDGANGTEKPARPD